MNTAKNLGCNIGLCLLLTGQAMAGIVFQTNFDNVKTWNPAGGAACWQNITVEGVGCNAPAGPLPAMFNDFRVQQNICSPNTTLHIGSASDIEAATGIKNATAYGGSGKSYVHLYEPCMSTSGGWGSDGLLGIFFGKTTGYEELYVQFNVKFQPGFAFASSGMMKLAHIMHSEGDVYDQGVLQAYNMFISANKPDLVPQAYYNTVYWKYLQDNPSYYPLNTDFSSSMIGPAVNIVDGNWHTLKYRVKLNVANPSQGIAQSWWDGVLQGDKTLNWTVGVTPTVAKYGFNRVIIGGNSNNTWLSGAANVASMPSCGKSCPNQWYMLDNLVVSTTDIATNYVPSIDIAPIPYGSNPPPTPAPPIKPKGFKVLQTNP